MKFVNFFKRQFQEVKEDIARNRVFKFMYLLLAALSLVVAWLYRHVWLPLVPGVLCAVTVIAMAVYDIKRRMKAEAEQRGKVLYNALLDCFFQAAREMAERFAYYPPIDRMEVMTEKSFVMLRDMLVVPFKLQKHHQSPLDEPQKTEIKSIISQRIDNNICAGNISGIPMPEMDGTRFYPYICHIKDTGIELIVYVAWRNDALLYNRPYQRPGVSPYDGRF